MSRRSLFVRLSAAATILIILALALAAFGLRAIFNSEIERRAAVELTQIVKSLAAQIRIDAQGAPLPDIALPDPRFDAPYGGLYWQVSGAGGRSARSRSLWDYELKIKEAAVGERSIVESDGPNNTHLLAVVQTILVASQGGGDVALHIAAALDRRDIAASQRSFLHLLVLSLAALGLILAVAMTFFIRLALRPFGELARELQAIHGGQSRLLSGYFPDEVQGVVDDLNRLVSFQDAALDRARTQAGDLAHGLKTPLAVLAALGRQTAEEGREDLAQSIEEQVTQMRRQVDRVLARARAGVAAVSQKRIAVEPVVDKVIRAFERLSAEKNLRWDCTASPQAAFPGDEGDLMEVLGNLLDNARKWAKSRVRLTAAATPGALLLRVEDDGPGLPSEYAAQIVRGRRWNDDQPGTGFGLAITRDIAEGYQGTLELGRSELGGLCASVTIPFHAGRL